ncbi:MAG: hypothetical protein Q4C01_00425 [Clostridia bacterium]|nr:hypothetical protein [Clostridia bacterium]
MKKILVILLSLLMIATLVACSGKDAESEQPSEGAADNTVPEQVTIDGADPAADSSAVAATPQPDMTFQTATYSGLTLYLPENWTYSELDGAFMAMSDDFYVDSASIMAFRGHSLVPAVTSAEEMDDAAVQSLVGNVIAEDENTSVTEINRSATLCGLPAIRIMAQTTYDEVVLYELVYVTVSPTETNFVLAATSLNYADLTLFDSLFGFTQPG